MVVVKSTENNYCIIFNPSELKLLEQLALIYREYMVTDIASCIKFIIRSDMFSLEVEGRP